MGPGLTRRTFLTASSSAIALAALGAKPALADSDKPKIGIGSKNFTESIIVGEIIALLLEDNGYEVERQLNLGGTLIAHEAMVSGDIDTYVEYTGTGLLAILGEELPDRDDDTAGSLADQVYDIVAERYPEEFDVKWLEPWGFNNTYALAMRREQAEELGVTAISDLQEHTGDLVVGAPQETLVREDGLPGLEKVYGLDFQDAVGLEPGLMYQAVDEGDVDVITAFATDSRIQSMDLVLLEDDKEFYPPYHAAPVIRQDLLEAAPEVEDILNQLADALDDARMTELNYLADEEGQETIDVARQFLEEEGLIGS